MKIKKILLNTRFRELAFSGLEAIIELKKAGLEKIVLTYIIPRPARTGFKNTGRAVYPIAWRNIQSFRCFWHLNMNEYFQIPERSSALFT